MTANRAHPAPSTDTDSTAADTLPKSFEPAEIEARWCALIGPRTFDRLDTALRDLIGLREAALLPKPQGGKKD